MSPRSARCRPSPAAVRGKALALLVLYVLAGGRAAAGGLLRQVRGPCGRQVEADMAWLAIAGAVASVIGAYYYLRIVYLMYFGEDSRRPRWPHGRGSIHPALMAWRR